MNLAFRTLLLPERPGGMLVGSRLPHLSRELPLNVKPSMCQHSATPKMYPAGLPLTPLYNCNFLWVQWKIRVASTKMLNSRDPSKLPNAKMLPTLFLFSALRGCQDCIPHKQAWAWRTSSCARSAWQAGLGRPTSAGDVCIRCRSLSPPPRQASSTTWHLVIGSSGPQWIHLHGDVSLQDPHHRGLSHRGIHECPKKLILRPVHVRSRYCTPRRRW